MSYSTETFICFSTVTHKVIKFTTLGPTTSKNQQGISLSTLVVSLQSGGSRGAHFCDEIVLKKTPAIIDGPPPYTLQDGFRKWAS